MAVWDEALYVRLDSGTLAPLLKRLEKQGLASRSRLESDERKLYIALTEQGEQLKKIPLPCPAPCAAA